MDRCRVGFELTEQLLLRTHQPTFTTRFFWRGIGGAVLVWHGVESLLIPPNGFKDPPIHREQPVALKTHVVQRGIVGAVVVWHRTEYGQHRRQTEAFRSDTHVVNRHDQRRDDGPSGSGGFGTAGRTVDEDQDQW